MPVVHGGAPAHFRNRQDFINHFTVANAEPESIHVVDPGDLEAVGEDEIKAVFGVVFHAGSREDGEGGMHATGAGHYHEVWRRVEGEWWLERLWMKRCFWKVRGGVGVMGERWHVSPVFGVLWMSGWGAS
ncbi:hypothetical protein CTRI78_v000543 [Colletotrichum trifolii]|uniref:SnoaL-like domain-containing protein n=1 Tax=Colletotrichum trifolii TaxID=5466 RepID=A0A4R8RVN8_COLTR|nr:hypothetical protein CTRI78_v000543 [Colletotrichum trifolii]